MKKSKAGRLSELSQSGLGDYLLPQFVVIDKDFIENPRQTVSAIVKKLGAGLFAVRSSANDEDQSESMAGKYLSLLGVASDDLEVAIESVLGSYSSRDGSDEVLIQPFVETAVSSGVVFTVDPNLGSNYWTLNWTTGVDTTAITSGVQNGESLVMHETHDQTKVKDIGSFRVNELLNVVKGVQKIIPNWALDIEWLQTKESTFILQVRPLAYEIPKTSAQQVSEELSNLKSRIISLQRPHPYLAGDTTIFGVMPDWNPAELIGIRPNTLAFSLFRELISESVWAYERSNLGYRNLRSFPLVLDFAGQPFVDLRISLNSLIPASVPDQQAQQLANYYLAKLIDNPTLHDKVEFEVVLSCYTFDWDDVVSELQFFDLKDQESLERSLIELTRNAITGDTYGLKDIVKKQQPLPEKFDAIDKGKLDSIGRAFWFLEDCKRHGTLPFAGIARLAFIATKLLDSLLKSKIVTEEELHSFTSGLETRTSKMVSDQAALSSGDFVKTYGHLRPGTFDITAPRYSDAFDLYFPAFGGKKVEPNKPDKPDKSDAAASFRAKVQNFLPKSGLDVSGDVFIEFCTNSIVAREESKFIFSRHVSAILESIADLAESLGFSRTQASHIRIKTIQDSYKDPGDLLSRVSEDIFLGERRERLSHSIALPTLIRNPNEVSMFRVSDVAANFVTLLSASGEVVGLESPTQDLSGKIVVIASADPGFDWIFTRGIAGMITAWGGANSHMSIRAKELQIPSAIGVGEKLYRVLLGANSCRLDCRNKKIEILS